MDLHSVGESESRFRTYVDELGGVVGHPARKQPLQDYCIGLMGPSERKSVEPIAAVTAPARTSAQHQSLLHFVGESDWSDEDVLTKVRQIVLPSFEAHGSVEAWIIDDTGFPKQGKHSVGVAAQYCGQLGREGNCQVAVSLSVANHHASLPVAYRLYLPREWARDRKRRRKAGVPEAIRFMTKPQIALEQIRAALAAGIARGVVLMDADYGRDGNLRRELRTLGLTYVAAIQSSPMVWSPGTGPKPGRRLPKAREEDADLVSIKDIVLALPNSAWKTIQWREGTAERLSSRFARVRVRLAREAEQWLLIEWPRDSKAATKYWLSNLPQDIAFDKLVDGTIRSSSRSSGSDITRDAVGAASIITRHSASLPMASSSPSGRRFPPQDLVPPRRSRKLPFPKVTDPEEPPLRPERHVPNSIATMRRRLAAALAERLPRCPCCGRPKFQRRTA
jgi:SRSO17 transposase